MTRRRQINEIPYTADQMFDLVADVERYPEFVPYCTGLRILRRNSEQNSLTAEMLVNYKVFRERFKCEVHMNKEENCIKVNYLEGPIRHLSNIWKFRDLGSNLSEIDFEIDFEFKSFIMQQVSNSVFDKAFVYMSNAFIDRAHAIYGE